MLRGEDTQEERSLFIFAVVDLGIRDDDVVHILLVVHRSQVSGLRDFPLLKTLATFCCLQNNVILVYFPQSVSLGFNSDYHEVHWNIWSFRDLFILLHEADDHLCLLLDCNTELWIVEPSIIGIELDMAFFVLFISICLNRVGPSGGVASPLRGNRILTPSRREDLAQVHLVVMHAPVLIAHPPRAIVTEYVVKLFLKALVIIPGLVLICELACPLALTPRVPDTDQLEAVHVPHI